MFYLYKKIVFFCNCYGCDFSFVYTKTSAVANVVSFFKFN